MPAANRSRSVGIVAASVAVHAVLLALVAVQAPRLRTPPVASGPPEAIIPILIMPRTPPATAAPGAKPTEVRLHRRPQPFANQAPPVAPLVTPAAEEPKRTLPAEGPRTTAPSTSTQDALAVNARNALRGKLGCANADALGLSRAEREACENQLAAGAKDAAFPGLGLSRDKEGILGQAAARREADYRYMRSGGGVGTVGAGPSANGNAVGRGNNLPGATSEDLAKTVGSDKPAYKIPF